MSEEQLRALMASTNKSIRELTASTKVMSGEFAKEMMDLKASQDRTGILLEKTIRGIIDLRKQTGNFINNDSLSDEEYFYRTMEAHPQLGNIVFHDVQRNMQVRKQDPEFDLVLFNDEAIAIIEVKKKAHPEEIPGLAEKQIQGFKASFPQYAHYRFYFGVASMITNETLIQVARDKRIFLLTQKGEELVLLNDSVRSL